MNISKLSILKLTPEKRRAISDRRRAIERALRAEYDAASEEFERVIALHLPGRVHNAHRRYIEAVVRLENFLVAGDAAATPELCPVAARAAEPWGLCTRQPLRTAGFR